MKLEVFNTEKLLTVFVFVFLLFGCGSDKSSDKTVFDEISSMEGLPFSFDLPKGIKLSDNQVDDIYITFDNNEIKGVAPSVDEDTTFNILLSNQEILLIHVTNREYVTISADTRNYAFANGNITKYNQFLTDNVDVPLVDISGQKVHYPVTVSKYAHDLYANYRSSKDPLVLDKFFINAHWLRDNCIYTLYGFCSWRTEPEYTPYTTGFDWSSAMAQGQAISVMISAYSLTQDDAYLKVAQDAIAAFHYPGKVKGVNSDWDGYVWYEEYTSEKPAHVLNGFLFAIAGLYDAMELLNDSSAKLAFESGIVALKEKLDVYDADFTSLYDNEVEQKRFASAKTNSLDGYHELHILQLAWVFQVTQEPKFLNVFKKFLSNDIGSFNTRKMKSGPSVKIASLTTTHSVNVKTNGPEYLTDRNWTYGNYWSTHRNGTEIEFTLNDVDYSPGVNCIMMSSISPKFFPESFDVFTYDGDNWLLAFARESVENLTYVDHVWVYQGKETTARTYCFNEMLKTSKKLKLSLVLPDSNLIALKEINVHYSRENIENELLSIYQSWNTN